MAIGVDTIVLLEIPKADRATLDYPRYTPEFLDNLQYRILDRLHPTGELNRVTSLVGMFLYTFSLL